MNLFFFIFLSVSTKNSLAAGLEKKKKEFLVTLSRFSLLLNFVVYRARPIFFFPLFSFFFFFYSDLCWSRFISKFLSG